MTRAQILSTPTVLGEPLVTQAGIRKRHVTILPTADIPLGQDTGGGNTYSHSGTTWETQGGGGSVYRQYTRTTPGAYMQWNLGMLQADRPWVVRCIFNRGPNRGIVWAYMNDVLIEQTDMDTYASTAASSGGAELTWTPSPDDWWKNHTFKLQVVSKNFNATHYGMNVAHVTLDRSQGPSTITPSAAA